MESFWSRKSESAQVSQVCWSSRLGFGVVLGFRETLSVFLRCGREVQEEAFSEDFVIFRVRLELSAHDVIKRVHDAGLVKGVFLAPSQVEGRGPQVVDDLEPRNLLLFLYFCCQFTVKPFELGGWIKFKIGVGLLDSEVHNDFFLS